MKLIILNRLTSEGSTGLENTEKRLSLANLLRMSRKNNLNSLIVASSLCLTLFSSATVSFRIAGGGATGRSSMFSEKKR